MANFTPQEIEEFLQEFFDTVGKRQYVGARYVPIFGRKNESNIDWDNSDAYEPLSIVLYNGDSYTSKRYVPKGIDILNTDYWVITGRYNAQVEQYRQEVLGFEDDLADKIPFPNSDLYPKYGTVGQVLTTLSDGTTKWENPVVPSDAQAEAIITEWLDEHPEATTTVQDGSITDVKVSATSGVMRYLANISSGNLDEFIVPNKAYLCLGTGVTNRPNNKVGLLVVLGAQPTNGAYMQLYMTRDGEVFTRSKYGNLDWTAWAEMPSKNNVMSYVFSDSNISPTSGIMRFLPNISTGDFNDYHVCNKTYLVLGTAITNQPISEPGLLVVFGAQPEGAFTQMYVARSGSIYLRSKYGTLDWTNWTALVDAAYVREQINASRETNILTAFSNITCCGDSLTFSQVYTGSTANRQAYVTYPQMLQKLIGTPTTGLAVSGYDPIAWWTDFASEITSKPNQLAIIYLGTNNGLTDTLATDCPTNTTYSNWANTNTGCYGKMVAKFKEVGARIVLVKCYATSGSGSSDLATTNNVITQIGSRFGCAVVDNYRLTDDKYHNYPDLSGLNSVHYNDLGYAAFTSYLIHQIGHLSTSQMSLLIPT